MVGYAIDPAPKAVTASAVRTCAKTRGAFRGGRGRRPAEEGAMDGTEGTAQGTGHGETAPEAPRFPLPSEIADAPGAEDWRSMYPYFTRFQPEDDQRFWFYNSMHFPEPMPAFDTITA